MIASDKSVRALIKSADSALEKGDVNAALRIVHDFVERIITEPVCTALVFSSRDLDQLCLRIGRYCLSNRVASHGDDFLLNDENEPTIVYVISRLQSSGGHSRLVQDFIRSQPEKKHLILSTEIGGPSDVDFYAKVFLKEGNVRFIQTPIMDFETRLRWLQSALLSSQPEHVYLFNHHQDSIAIAAVVPELNLTGSFCHHGDHHLCLGVHADHLTHMDFHPMGFHHCRNEFNVKNQYLPLTFQDKQCIPFVTDFMQGGTLTTATAARSNKVEIPYYVRYIDAIARILNATGGKHLHIGKLTPWALFRIRRQLRKHGIQKNRFVYIEWTPSVWKTLQKHKVDVYIASFPYGAGLTLIEAMGAAVPVILHEHMYSRILSGLELAYPDAYRWSDLDDLLKYLATIQPEHLEREKKLSRQQYERFHRPEILQAYLHDSDAFQLKVPELNVEYAPRLDEWAAVTEQRIRFKSLMYRSIYRTLRWVRSRFRLKTR